MENYSLNKKKIDWPTIRANIIQMANDAKKPSDTYPVIRIALAVLEYHHSFFMEPQQVSAIVL